MEKDRKGAKNEKKTWKAIPEKNSCHAACPFADAGPAVRLRKNRCGEAADQCNAERSGAFDFLCAAVCSNRERLF